MTTQPALPNPSLPRRRHPWRLGAGLVAATALLTLAACAGGGGDTASSEAGGAADMSLLDEDGMAPEAAAAPREALAKQSEQNGTGGSTADAAYQAITRSVISTGVMALRGNDVAELRFDVRQVVDEHGGEVTDEQTESDTDGKVARARLVVRVPAKEFDATMVALEKAGDVESSTRTSEDVTTQVIDTNVRVRAQQASLQRIETLLSRAESLRDIVSIESELTRRQADLDSLKQQQAWLADQTSTSTITVNLRHTQAVTKPKEDKTGFLAGLAAGWRGLTKVTNGGLTAFGALLPFGLVLLAIGLPLFYLVRRTQRRRTPAEPQPTTAS